MSYAIQRNEPRYTLTDVMRRLDVIERFLLFMNNNAEKLMATMDETVAALAAAKDSIDAVGVEVAKVGSETDGLIKAVADLTAALSNVQTSPAVDAAVAAVQASADAVAAAVKGVDDKVADAA